MEANPGRRAALQRQRAGVRRGATLALLACAAAGCGQKGPLVLPPAASAAPGAPAASAAAGAASVPAGTPTR